MADVNIEEVLEFYATPRTVGKKLQAVSVWRGPSDDSCARMRPAGDRTNPFNPCRVRASLSLSRARPWGSQRVWS